MWSNFNEYLITHAQGDSDGYNSNEMTFDTGAAEIVMNHGIITNYLRQSV